MGTLYLIDRHNPTVSSSVIKDTFVMNGGTREIRGTFPVNLPFDVPIDGTPATVGDLITQKYAGLLSLYPGHSHILYDEQLDGSGWDTTKTNTDWSTGGYTVGSRKTTKISENTNLPLLTNAVTLATTPTNFIFRYEIFKYLDTDGTQYSRLYSEDPPTTNGGIGVSVTVTFNDSVYTDVVSGAATAIPTPSQGNTFRAGFRKVGSPGSYYIGSWALIY